MELTLLAGLATALYVCWGIGSNDETMAPLAGSGFIRLKATALLGAVMAFLGAVIFGQRVETTIGKKLLLVEINNNDVFIVLFSIATWLTLASYWGWPISTTHSSLGSVIGLGLIKGGLSGIVWITLGGITIAWVASPLIGLVGSMVLAKFFRVLLKGHALGLRQMMRTMRLSSLLLLFWISLTAFSRGANDIGNATALLSSTIDFKPPLVRALGGAGMALGLFILGRRVLKSVGLNLVELNPVTALATQVSVALTMFIGTFFGLPLSGTHVLVGALIGLGVSEGIWLNIKGLTEILYTSLSTFIISASITVATYLLVALF